MANVSIGAAEISKIKLKESSAPSTPASGYGYLYLKDAEHLAIKGDDGSERVFITDIENSYAGMYLTNNSDALSLTTQNQWYQLVEFDTNGLYTSQLTPDHTNDHITVNANGVYRVSGNFSFSGSGSSTMEIQIKKNNGATSFDNLILRRMLGASGDVGSASLGPGYVSLTATDTVEVWCRCTDGASKSITVVHAVLTIERVSD